MADFDRLNRETQNARNYAVDRFNESTKANYTSFDPWRQNNQTYKQNNGEYSNYYSNK